MSHYKGKLTARGDLVCDSSGNSLWDYHEKSSEENEADTRRLVACWNALDGVPTEWLENYVVGNAKNVIQENAALKREVDLLKKVIQGQQNEFFKLTTNNNPLVASWKNELAVLRKENLHLKQENSALKAALSKYSKPQPTKEPK